MCRFNVRGCKLSPCFKKGFGKMRKRGFGKFRKRGFGKFQKSGFYHFVKFEKSFIGGF